MNFRFADTEDAMLLTQLRINMRKERETVPPPADQQAFFNSNLEFFQESLDNGSYIGIIAEDQGRPVATGGICLHIHPPSYGVPNGRSACLLNMYTIPEFRGRGLAGKILAALVEKAREKKCCKVFLNASDMGKPLYQKFGFKDLCNEMVFDLN